MHASDGHDHFTGDHGRARASDGTSDGRNTTGDEKMLPHSDYYNTAAPTLPSSPTPVTAPPLPLTLTLVDLEEKGFGGGRPARQWGRR